MADCSYGEVQIGGKVARSLLPALVEHLKEHGLLDDTATPEDLKPNEKGILSFEKEETPGGGFYELEEFLKKQKIDYDAQSSPSFYYDPDNVSWRNGEGWTDSREATAALRRCLKKLPKMSPAEIKEFVRRYGPPPKLRKFEIIDE